VETNNLGGGKTLFMVERAYMKYRQGSRIFSNIKLNFKYEKLTLKDIIDCKYENGVIVWDEIHINIGSRSSMSKKNIGVTSSFLSQIRKKNLEVYGTTQRIGKVDKRLRDECDFWYVCDRFVRHGSGWEKVKHNQNLDKNIPILVRVKVTKMYDMTERNYYFLGNKYFNMYDTKEVVKIEGLD